MTEELLQIHDQGGRLAAALILAGDDGEHVADLVQAAAEAPAGLITIIAALQSAARIAHHQYSLLATLGIDQTVPFRNAAAGRPMGQPAVDWPRIVAAQEPGPAPTWPGRYGKRKT